MPRLSKIGAAALAAFGWTGGASVTASYLVVAGGGGAGFSAGGGGGAGGLKTGTTSLNPTQSYTVTVGAGGTAGTSSGVVTNGGNSVFNSITSTGGGQGGEGGGGNVGSGGSGGGGAGGTSGFGTGTSGQGNNGGAGQPSSPYGAGGGGGAGAVGSQGTTGGGNGGNGSASSISGTSVTYAGGGGGGIGGNNTTGTGGTGGGGNGGASADAAGSNGTTNLGGGGGGGRNSTVGTAGGSGGSGVVIISYTAPQQFGGGVVTTSGSNVIHTFNTSGTLTPLSSLTASYLVVAGGGGSATSGSGGGGAGGYRTGSGLTIDTNSIYLVTVGAGGGSNASGSDSFFWSTTSTGGGRGVTNTTVANGGSGGGASSAAAGGLGNTPSTSPSQGNNGGYSGGFNAGPQYPSGGGGGASAAGANASSQTVSGAGGAGTANSISGTSVTYAGGGGGSIWVSGNTPGAGGLGGGGTGQVNGGAAGTNGTANTGGGAGGSTDGTTGNSGGSGVVIISYAGSTQQMAGGTVTITGGNVIHTFTSSGYLTPIKLVNNSLRFRSSASAYLSRTLTTPTNNKIFTWSGWLKLGKLSDGYGMLSTTATGAPRSFFVIDSNTLWFLDQPSGTNASLNSVAVLRDPSAWYHIVFAVDTTQATSTNRVKMYINGVQATLTGTYPTQNTNPILNSATAHTIGSYSINYFDGYMTEVNFIDGQQLTPTSFGTFNSYGVWQPITYGGSYGTNGFYLPFTNTTSATTLAYDFSPNGNNWTPNNISTTAGVTYDSMTDVPTLTSATAANYCVVDVLSPIGSASALSTVASANLQLTHSGSTYSQRFGNMVVSSGKWYFEFTLTNIGYPSLSVGVSKLSTYPTYNGAGGQATSCAAVGYFTGTSLSVCTEAGGTGAGSISSQTWSNGDIIMVAFSIDTGKIWWGKNGTWYSSGNPAADTNNITTITSGAQYRPWVVLYGTTTDTSLNFGQRPFSYSAPTGFVALNTYNL